MKYIVKFRFEVLGFFFVILFFVMNINIKLNEIVYKISNIC